MRPYLSSRNPHNITPILTEDKNIQSTSIDEYTKYTMNNINTKILNAKKRILNTIPPFSDLTKHMDKINTWLDETRTMYTQKERDFAKSFVDEYVSNTISPPHSVLCICLAAIHASTAYFNNAQWFNKSELNRLSYDGELNCNTVDIMKTLLDMLETSPKTSDKIEAKFPNLENDYIQQQQNKSQTKPTKPPLPPNSKPPPPPMLPQKKNKKI
jgi:hypothetical protein